MFDIIAPKPRRGRNRAPAAGPSRAADWRKQIMIRTIGLGALATLVAMTAASVPAAAQQQQQQQQQKPNILFIMGDDIGWMQPSIYHRGLMVGETPNIDRIGQEGAMFTEYYAEQSCTAGRPAFITGEFGKNHLGDTTESLPTAHGFQEYWGYLYHLDAMQGVSFPDINKTPTQQS